MGFHQAFIEELEKLAVKANGVSFYRFNSDKPRIFRQMRPIADKIEENHPTNKAIRWVGQKAGLSADAEQVINKSKRIRTNQLGRDVIDKKKNDYYTGGVTVPGFRVAAINMADNFGDLTRRETIAHEAFHAKNRIIGRSETLAHAYGGWRKTKGANLRQKVRDAVDSVKRYRRFKSGGVIYK